MTPSEKISLRDFVDQSAKLVDAELNRVLPDENLPPVQLHKAVRHSVFAGGKRFRPALMFAVADVFGVKASKIVGVAAAVEMVHTYSLIHDDLPAMDDDDLRRGRPTCHKLFGDATAILAGDTLQALAFEALSSADELSNDIRIRLIRELAIAAGTPKGMVAGQQLDLDGEGKQIDADELTMIHRKKTGAMIEFSVRAGAIIGGASEDELSRVSLYGRSLGLLFQITDDLLDVIQSTSVLGKTAGKDADVDKATYPAFFGIEGTKKMAEDEHLKSREAVSSFENSRLLLEISDYVLNREN